jgi:hypothetical protein
MDPSADAVRTSTASTSDSLCGISRADNSFCNLKSGVSIYEWYFFSPLCLE